MKFSYSPKKRLDVKKRKMSRLFFSMLLLLVVFIGYREFFHSDSLTYTVSNSDQVGRVMGVEDLNDLVRESIGDIVVSSHTISEGDIPATVFSEHGRWDANDTIALIESATDVYDLTNLKIGRQIRFFFNGEEKATRMEYDRDTEEMIVAERSDSGFSIFKEAIAYEVSEERADIVIDSFLYQDALEAGMSEATIIELADVFAYAIDFTTEIRQGDETTLIYERRLRDGERGPDGRIKAARFQNDGEEYYAYYFEHNGEGGYYDGDGHAIVRQFLRAPLSFSRITSGYTGARLHPITRTVSAHYQIDYAAPTGTPVVSTARGTVTGAGWEGGWGYIVRVRHDNGYTTHYAHLNSFASGVRTGTRVAQGQLVGYVGSTGWSTGPHLDYGMRLNGSPVNPLTLVQPKGPPLEGEAMEAFERMKGEYAGQL